jgi:hypothetical protein
MILSSGFLDLTERAQATKVKPVKLDVSKIKTFL